MRSILHETGHRRIDLLVRVVGMPVPDASRRQGACGCRQPERRFDSPVRPQRAVYRILDRLGLRTRVEWARYGHRDSGYSTRLEVEVAAHRLDGTPKRGDVHVRPARREEL